MENSNGILFDKKSGISDYHYSTRDSDNGGLRLRNSNCRASACFIFYLIRFMCKLIYFKGIILDYKIYYNFVPFALITVNF